MELVKGALAGVLGFKLGRTTAGIKFSEGDKGRLIIDIQRDSQPTPAEMQQVVDVIQQKIASDEPCFTLSLARSEAEEKFQDCMYDKFEVPAHITDLNLFYMPGFMLHCSPDTYLDSCGGVGTIEFQKHKFRANKKELEIQFTVKPVAGHTFGTNPTCAIPDQNEILPLNKNEVRISVSASGKESNDSKETVGSSEQEVNPWSVETDQEIDYDKLIVSFGSRHITEDQVARIERLTNRRAHRWLRRGVFFSQRDLTELLDLYEKGEKFYLYTGRGPSSEALHLGHLLPFHFTQWLQEAFNVPLVVQLTDDEKFLFNDKLTLEETHRLAYANARDIIACGFDQSKTFIFSDLDYIHHMYPMILKIQRCVTFNQARGIFGFTDSDNIGRQAFPAVQACPSFPTAFEIPLKGSKSMPCLIPCAIDQDAYFRMTRDVAPRLGFKKPALIHSKFFPPLQGKGGKMSASLASTSIYVTDTPAEIKKKVNKYAFSGGQETLELQRQLGANIDVDVPYQYLKFFMEDDERLEQIGRDYKSGALLSGEVKVILIEVLSDLVKTHQERKAAVTDEVLNSFLAVRPLEF